MENTLLVGLSRQIALQRELDVVANNIANLNTTGFKADSVAVRGISDAGRARGQFRRPATAGVSFVQDRATWHDFSPGPGRADRQPARRRDRRRRLPRRADAARRALHPQRRAADQRQGQLVTSDGYQVLGDTGPIVFQPTDKRHLDRRRRHVTVREGTNTHRLACAASCAWSPSRSAQQLQKEGSNLYARRRTCRPRSPTPTSRVAPGRDREIERQLGVIEMTRMIEVTRTYTQISPLLQQQSDMRKSAIEKLAEVPA